MSDTCEIPAVETTPCAQEQLRSSEPKMKMLRVKASDKDTDLLLFDIIIKGHKFTALIDSGATGMFLSTRVLDKTKLQAVEKDMVDEVRLANGSTMKSTHVARVGFRMGRYQDIETFHTMDLPDFDIVLGKPWLRRINPVIDWKKGTLAFTHGRRRMKLEPLRGKTYDERTKESMLMSSMELRRALQLGHEAFMLHLRLTETADGVKIESPPEDSELEDRPAWWDEALKSLLEKYKDVIPPDPDWQPPFPPERAVDHKIELKPGSTPPNRPIYRMSQPELEELRKQLNDLLERGYIQPSTSPYGSPVLLVKKPGSTAMRLCVDYRVLNSQTLKNAYPVPPMHDLLDRLHGMKVFSKADLASGFWQVRLDPESVPLTAFRTRFGLFEFKVMPFGLCNAPATFQRLMNDIIVPLDGFAVVYLDDVLIFSKDHESHVEHVEAVLKLLREHKLYARPNKCEFGRRKIKYLGHYVSGEGIHVDPDKIKSIMEWPTPKNRKDVLQFKGMCEFYRRHVKDISKIAAPLTALTGNVPWHWGEIEEKAFNGLKEALSKAPILAPPDYSRQFIVTTDASKFAIGAVLSQGEGIDMRVVAFESRKMTDCETRYDVHDKELLAVIHALKKWAHHLRGRRFVCVTDNWATKYIQTKPHLNQRQMNWLGTLADYDMDIVHRPGKTNIVADALSRRPDYSLNAVTWLKADDGLYESIRKTVDSDLEYKRVLAGVQKGTRKDFQLQDGLLYKGTRLYVPAGSDLRDKLLYEAHDAPLSGHLGRDKTCDRLTRVFYWPKMHHMVYEYCKTCLSCQAIKPSHQAPMGLLKPHTVPAEIGDSWSMDFIMPLPKTRRGHTAIATFVERMSKYVILAPCKVEVTAEEVATLFRQEVVRHFGVPKGIISDRDPRFTADFWKSLMAQLGTKLNMSSANHPETDGQSEKANQVVEDMVRAYVSPYQDDWDDHLVSCEFAYNDSENASHRYTPFYLVHGRHPNVPLNMLMRPTSQPSNESVKAYMGRLRAERESARAALKAAQDRQAKYANRHRREYTFEVGDKVWLAASHLRLPRAALAGRKLLPRFYGPYAIKRVISDVAYELELPAHFRIHPVIHISHLKASADGSRQFPLRPEYVAPPPPEIGDEDGEEYFHVEAFRNHRRHGSRRQFLVKWRGYPEEDNEWISETNLRKDLTDSFEPLLEEYVQRTDARL